MCSSEFTCLVRVRVCMYVHIRNVVESIFLLWRKLVETALWSIIALILIQKAGSIQEQIWWNLRRALSHQSWQPSDQHCACPSVDKTGKLQRVRSIVHSICSSTDWMTSQHYHWDCKQKGKFVCSQLRLNFSKKKEKLFTSFGFPSKKRQQQETDLFSFV